MVGKHFLKNILTDTQKRTYVKKWADDLEQGHDPLLMLDALSLNCQKLALRLLCPSKAARFEVFIKSSSTKAHRQRKRGRFTPHRFDDFGTTNCGNGHRCILAGPFLQCKVRSRHIGQHPTYRKPALAGALR